MRKNRVGLSVLISTSVITLLATVTGTFAWFAEHTLDDPVDVNIDGSATPYHYASGTGTSGDPYIIREPIHLYNLAWLQYLGTYNKDDNDDGVIDQQWYFKLADDIPASGLDMSGYTLPPIGTEDYPFIGNFNGNNKKIVNLTTSNNETDFGSRIPHNLDYTAPEIVGFFGVVGKLDGDYTYNSSINTITNLNLNNLTVVSKTNKTLIGLAAGYVNGNMSGVKLSGNVTLDVNDRTCSSLGGEFTKLSDYGLVGYSTKRGGGGDFSQKISKYFDSDDGEGQGDDNDWGGSINPRLYNRWIYDSYKGTSYDHEISTMSSSISTINTITNSDYKLAFSTVSRTNQRTSHTQYNNYCDPDYIDQPQDGWSVATNVRNIAYQLKDGCYLPLRFADDEKTGTHSKNTGYIIGSSSGNLGSPKLSSYFTVNIGNSLKNTKIETTGIAGGYSYANNYSYVDSDLELLTYSINDSAWYRVEDSHNIGHTTTNALIKDFPKKSVEYLGFEKYNDSRNTLQTIFESATTIQGIHFENYQVSSSNLLNVASNIKITGTTYNTTYQLPKGSIDFNLKRTGFINFFAGTYYSSVIYNFGFFTLNHVFRNGGTISSIKKIDEIYQNKYWNRGALSDSITNPKFFYKYSDGTFSNIVANNVTRAATVADRDTEFGNDGLLFDVKTVLEGVLGTSGNILRQAVNNLLFYFEIPVNNGEYAMGMPAKPSGITSYTGAYMIYLDIGANADSIDSDVITGYSVLTETTMIAYPLGVDFDVTGSGNNGGSSFCVYIASGKKGTISFELNNERNNISITSTASLSVYSYQSGTFGTTYTVSGNSPGELEEPPGGGTKLIHIRVETTESVVDNVLITDILDDEGNIDSSTYSVNGENKTIVQLQSLIESLTDDVLEGFRTRDIAVTLTRISGTNTFDATLPTLPWENSGVYAITLDATGLSLRVNLANDVTATINGTPVSNNSVYPS